MILYFLLDLPGDQPREFLGTFLPRMRGAWDVFDLVQVRAKDAAAKAYVEAVEQVRAIVGEEAGARPRMGRTSEGFGRVRKGGRPLVLANDRLDVALATGADGVHVGAEDLPPELIRRLELRPDFVVGLTCHTLSELEGAPVRGVDYLGVGAFFPSPTKPGPIPDPRPALRELPPDFPLPIYAIGGVMLERLPEVLAVPHVAGVVVSSAIQAARDPAAAARAFREKLGGL